jgi:tripeptidyl-peptidase-1
VIVFNNKTEGFGGTSCSSPGFASVIALINDRLVAQGAPVLGFLNPWLYANAAALADITIGHNSGDACENTTFSGFDASAGWDPLSKWGGFFHDTHLHYRIQLAWERRSSINYWLQL